MWLCVQIKPGMIVLPATSTFSASAGTSVVSFGPTATIFPALITSVPEGISSPSIGMIFAPTNARALSSASVHVDISNRMSDVRNRVAARIQRLQQAAKEWNAASALRVHRQDGADRG